MFWNFLKGMAMGAADIVPGVSGGTVALVTGIYERLINAIKAIGLDTLLALRKNGLNAAWQQIDGTFLLSVLTGVLTSVVAFARLLHYCIEHYPIEIWSLFFGLVLASAFYVGKQVTEFNKTNISLLIVGAAVAASISLSGATQVEISYLNVFLAGSLAICAMILPGISGSFIMLLLGMYTYIIGAIKSFDMVALLVFASGCAIGIMLFSRLLSWVLKRYHNATMALLTGFMFGALVKLWPWKDVIEYRINSQGLSVPFIEHPIWPWLSADSQLFSAICFFLLGFLGVFILDRLLKSPNLSEK